jgi:hypothetical protein
MRAAAGTMSGGESIDVQNFMIHEKSIEAHGTPVNAASKETAANYLSHTEKGLVSSQDHGLIGRSASCTMNHAFMTIGNSSADSLLGSSGRLDFGVFKEILQFGGFKGHHVVDMSQRGTGIGNELYTFAMNPHGEYIYYNGEKKRGACAMQTTPLNEEGVVTRDKSGASVNKRFAIGFYLDDSGEIKFRGSRNSIASEALQMYLMVSKLSGECPPSGFNCVEAEKHLGAFIMETVVKYANSEQSQGHHAFMRVVDLEDCTYVDPVTKRATQCFSETDDDLLYTYIQTKNDNPTLKHVSFRKTLQDQYQLPDVAEMKQWKCANGDRIRQGLNTYDIAIVLSGNRRMLCTEAITEPRLVPSHFDKLRPSMTASNLVHTHAFHLPCSAADARSLGINTAGRTVPDTVPVPIYYFTGHMSDGMQLCPMWRESLYPPTAERARVLMQNANQSHQLVRKTLETGNIGNFRAHFISFARMAGFEMAEVNGKMYFTDRGCADFLAVSGNDPNVVLHSLETWANHIARPNDRREEAYGINVTAVVQYGNFQPDFNKVTGMADGDKLAASYFQVVRGYMMRWPALFPITGTVEQATKKWKLNLGGVLPASQTADASAPRNASTAGGSAGGSRVRRRRARVDESGDESTDESVGSAHARAPSAQSEEARSEDAQERQPAKRARNRSTCPDLREKGLEHIVERAACFIELSESQHGDELQSGDQERAAAVAKRIKRLEALRNEATKRLEEIRNGTGSPSLYVLANAPRSMSGTNVKHSADVQIYWAIVGGVDAPEWHYMNKYILMELMIKGPYRDTNVTCRRELEATCSDETKAVLTEVCNNQPGAMQPEELD